jgi:uncharacterized protein (TIGR02145 family)
MTRIKISLTVLSVLLWSCQSEETALYNLILSEKKIEDVELFFEKFEQSELRDSLFSHYSEFDNGKIVDERDGETYTYSLGPDGNLWINENIRFETANSLCYENESPCSDFGKLYPFEDLKNVCPKSWSIPEREDWYNLFNYYGGVKEESSLQKRNANADGEQAYTKFVESPDYGMSLKLGGEYYLNTIASWLTDPTWHFSSQDRWGYYWSKSKTPRDESIHYRVVSSSSGNGFIEELGAKARNKHHFSCKCFKFLEN